MGLMSLMSLMGLMGLMGCSEDAEDFKGGVAIEVRSSVTDYEEADGSNKANRAYGAGAITRAWLPPSGYTVFTEDNSISIFFTQTGEEPEGGYKKEHFYKNGDKWNTDKDDLEPETYYLYGFVPHDNSIGASISKLPGEGKTYADGAILTITNLPSIMSTDFCVVVGAKNGKDDYKENQDYSVTGLKRGDFEYIARASGEGVPGNNYVYLLFDHVYAAMRVRIKVYGAYNDIRTIKLKELKLKTCDGDVPTPTKSDATITLTKTTDGSDPISAFSFTPTGGGVAEGSMYSNSEGLTLTPDYSIFMNHFMPQGVSKFILESSYDVYDKQGNLIRPNCKATNTIILEDLISGQTVTRRGARYTINLTVRPTYLYLMSEPDADNPTVVVN